MCASVQTILDHLPYTSVSMPRRSRIISDSTRVLDYPASMSAYEIESLAAEATLAQKKAKPRKKKRNLKRKSCQRAKDALVVI